MFMLVQHLNCGARGRLQLVEDGFDLFALLEEIAIAFRGRLLAYILLPTHLHLVAEGDAAESTARLEDALAAFARFVARRGREAPVLRGPIYAAPKTDPFELMRSILYVHRKNAQDMPGIERPLEYPWSSERAYVGLRVAGPANVARALALLGREYEAAVRGPSLPLADLEPALFPSLHPEVLAAASADVYGVSPHELAGAGRGEAVTRARATFFRLGVLERYALSELAPLLGRSRSRASRLVSETPAEDRALRMARTIARDPGIVRHLPRSALRGTLGGRPWHHKASTCS